MVAKVSLRPQCPRRRKPRHAVAGAIIGAFALACAAHAAKVTVSWTNPTLNTDGTPITNLAGIWIDWGTCSGIGVFGHLEGSLFVAATVPGAQMSAALSPSVTTTTCIEAQAEAADGARSAFTAPIVWTPPPTTGKPVTLGQPIELPPT